MMSKLSDCEKGMRSKMPQMSQKGEECQMSQISQINQMGQIVLIPHEGKLGQMSQKE